MSSDNADDSSAAPRRVPERSRTALFGSRLWVFLNSSFGLWLLSSVVLSAGTVLVPQWWHKLRESEENEIEMLRISREIICRLQVSITIAEGAIDLARDPAYTAPDLPAILLSSDGTAARLCNIQMLTNPQTMHSLLVEWQRLAPKYVGVASIDPTLLESAFGDLSHADISTLTHGVRSVDQACLKSPSGADQGPISENDPAFKQCRISKFAEAAAALLAKVKKSIDKVIEILTPVESLGVRG